MHVLYVAWGFPPHRGPGVYRALATVEHLCSRGHEVTVLTADSDFFDVVTGGDGSLVDRIDPRVRVLRLPFPAGQREPVVNRWPETRVTSPSSWTSSTRAAEQATFPENGYAAWRPRIELAAYRLHREHPVDLVVATGNPYVDFAVPAMLHAEFGVPYVLDDRDSWVVNVYTGEPYEAAAAREVWLEPLLAASLETWFVNPPIAGWHSSRWPQHASRISVVENGWDADFLDPSALPAPSGLPPVLGFVGTVNAGLPLGAIVDGFVAAKADGLDQAAELRIYGGLGHVSGTKEQLDILARGAAYGVRHMGRWPKARIAEAYAALDALVFAKEGGAMVTSGKVYEYVATGKPIAGVIEAAHDARRVLAGYPRAHLTDEHSAKAWALVLRAAADDAATADATRRAEALLAGQVYRRDRILGPALDRVLASVAGGGA